jgi:hypothetical protein
MAEIQKPPLPVHPLIATVVQAGQSERPLKLTGYLGPPDQAGKVRLYSTLDDLSHYVELDENAVVQTVEASETELTNKGQHVWVKESAPVRWVHEYPTASSFTADIARNLHRLNGWKQ